MSDNTDAEERDPAPRTARRVTIHEARRHFEQGDEVLVSERGHEPTQLVGPLTTLHSRETTRWAALVEEVRQWRGRYPGQRFYVVPAEEPDPFADALDGAEKELRRALDAVAGYVYEKAAALTALRQRRALDAVGGFLYGQSAVLTALRHLRELQEAERRDRNGR